MRSSWLVLAALCAAPIMAACDSGTPTSPAAEEVTITGFVGKGIFSDTVSGVAAFQLVASDSSGKDAGQLIMGGDVVPPAGTYDLDAGSFPVGLSNLSVGFLRPLSGGTAELYQPAGGNMVITSIAGDSVAGTLAFSMAQIGTCPGTRIPVTCQPLTGSTARILHLSGTFIARDRPGSFPGS